MLFDLYMILTFDLDGGVIEKVTENWDGIGDETSTVPNYGVTVRS